MRQCQKPRGREKENDAMKEWNPGEKNKKQKRTIHSTGFMNFNQAFDECNHGGNWSTEAGPFCLMIVGHWEQAVQPPWVDRAGANTTVPALLNTNLLALKHSLTLRSLAPVANIPTAVLLSSSISLSQSLSVSVLRIRTLTTLVTAQEDVKD